LGNTEYAAIDNSDGIDWFERSNYWLTFKPKRKIGAPKKFYYREPLIICGHGARIRVDKNTLLVRSGFTHYPQKTKECRFFPGDANLPDRIIIIDGSGGITFDAIRWMSEQRIEFIQLDWRGNATAIGGNCGYIANSKLVELQRAIKGSKRSLEIIRSLINRKLRASIDTLIEAIPKSDKSTNAVTDLKRWVLRLENRRSVSSIPKIHGIEGGAARAYFQTWQGIPIHWSGLSRKPIPKDWHEVGPRNMSWRGRRQAAVARHPVNAMLNYGYAMLKAKVRREILIAGFDPTIGLMHGNSSSNIPLVHDLMEPLRPVVDAKILSFVQTHTFNPGDFTISSFGGCRLNPQMARAVVRAVDVDAAGILQGFKIAAVKG